MMLSNSTIPWYICSSFWGITISYFLSSVMSNTESHPLYQWVISYFTENFLKIKGNSKFLQYPIYQPLCSEPVGSASPIGRCFPSLMIHMDTKLNHYLPPKDFALPGICLFLASSIFSLSIKSLLAAYKYSVICCTNSQYQ